MKRTSQCSQCTLHTRRCLSGTYVFSVDRKGRVVIPAHFRRELGESFALIEGEAGVIVVAADHPRAATAPAPAVFYCTADRVTGRILVPHWLRQVFGFRPGTEVTVAGQGDHASITPAPLAGMVLRRAA